MGRGGDDPIAREAGPPPLFGLHYAAAKANREHVAVAKIEKGPLFRARHVHGGTR